MAYVLPLTKLNEIHRSLERGELRRIFVEEVPTDEAFEVLAG